MLLAWSSANRDPEQFENPDEVDIERWPNRHVAFGLGVHRCAGSHLGRAMAKEMLSQILNRMGDYVVDESALRAVPAAGHEQRLDEHPGHVHARPRASCRGSADPEADPVLLPAAMESFDVVVLGTGAAGLCAALAAADSGATVGLFEKGDRVGGTTALASAVAWIPNNKYAAAAGVQDSREDGAGLPVLALARDDPARARRGARRHRPRALRLAGDVDAAAAAAGAGLPRLPPGAPGRETTRRPVARARALLVLAARGLGRPHGRHAAAACA